ncbi:MAG: YgiT-type zinc finger protein [Caldilineaceae bacterium]|nr:YgiT-type zinc finger protein [Caldilineaceae bacterium]
MKCSVQGCPGEYEEKKIIHTVVHRGEIVVIEDVPAEVCTICGDVLFTLKTVREIEALLMNRSKPKRTVPLYQFAA